MRRINKLMTILDGSIPKLFAFIFRKKLKIADSGILNLSMKNG